MSAAAHSFKDNLAHDALASVVVFLVALPLCLGIAIASGVPPVLGLISGMVGGIVVGAFSGCPLQVSGPAAGLAVLCATAVHGAPSLEEGILRLALMTLGAGILQIAAGALRVGPWFRAVSPAVIQGMLSGIGVLIFASQFHVMLDNPFDDRSSGGWENLRTIPQALYQGLLPLDWGAPSQHHQAAGLGLLTIVILIAWSFAPKKLRRMPAALLAVIVSSGVALATAASVILVQVPADFLGTIDFLHTARNLHRFLDPSIIVGAFSFAAIASAETLLCATATDRLHDGERTNYDKELLAQGIGNSLCGLLGALPVTGVVVRSTANIEAGARTRMSAVLHGVWLIALCAALPQLLGYIPRASLAAILVYIGYKLANPKAFMKLKQTYGWGEALVFAATVTTIVATNLLTGVLVGLGLAAASLLKNATQIQVRVRWDEEWDGYHVCIRGAASFLGLPILAQALESIPQANRVEIGFEHLHFIDAACRDFIESYAERRRAAGGEVAINWAELNVQADLKQRIQSGSPSGAQSGELLGAGGVPSGKFRLPPRPETVAPGSIAPPL